MTISTKMSDVLRVRSELLTMDVIGKIKGTAFILNSLPDIISNTGEAVKVRTSTANYFTVREKGSRSRAKLNDDARSILARVRSGELPENALTDDQKRTLAQYSGCGGGLKHADGTMGSAYEYYTPKPVAEGVWDALADLGFRGGKVLDPCAGAGIFGATSPTNCVIDAVELSEESALVNKLVNGGPGYTVKNSPFEAVAAATPDEIYDAVVTNVPFGEVADRGENNTKDPKYQNEPLECYFILRSLEKLRPGGMAAFIVPTRCMDGKDGKQRSMRQNASLMAEFVGAYRLPTGTFASADTQTVTDIMFFRKYSRDMKEKIDSLTVSNPSILSEANVVWDDFISGKYYLTSEGKPYVFGTFEAGNGGRWDADKYVYTGNILADFKDLIKKRRLPKSRVNWDLLGQTETEPIAYNEGDHITQGGVTLEMRDGAWVQLGESAAPEHDTAKQTMANLASPYKAFESGVTYEQARVAMDVLIAQSAYDQIPDWARTTHNAIRNSRKITEAKREAFWRKAVVATAAQLLVEDRGAEVNYLEEYPELSKAMAENEVKQGDIGSVPGVVKAALQVCRGYYTKKAGYSALWRGEIGTNAAAVNAVDDRAYTPEMKYEALRYRSKSTWNSLDEVKAIYGADFDPMASDDWCISADGKSVAKADDVFCGKYKDAIKRIDADIANAANDEIRYKLIRQKSEAERRVNRLDVSRVHFSLHSPFVTVDEKMAFLRQMVTEDVVIAVDDRGRPYPDIQVQSYRKTLTDEEKLLNRFGDYMKNGGIGLGGVKLNSMTEEEALEKLGAMIRKAEAQFDAWARANPTILSRLEASANDEENLRFRPASDDSTFAVQGMNPALHLHSYQCDFVRKMGREFGGINGFGVGLGKAQPLDAKVLTPDGWVEMGSIKVGDYVISRNGLPTRVTAIYPQGKKEIFEVVFSDGAKTRCCDEHLWLTQTETDRKKMSYHRSRGRDVFIEGTPKLLSEIRSTLVYGKKQKNHKIPMVHPVQFAERNFAIHPYLLGAILGDGGMTAKSVSFTNSDQEVVSKVRELLVEGFDGVDLKHISSGKSYEYKISKTVADGGVNSFAQALGNLGLRGCRSENKFVPAEYLFGSISQRLDLLHGLMDTDGYVSKDGFTVQFSSASEALSMAVKELVQSLGGIAWVTVKKTKGLDAHVVSIRMPEQFNPFSLTRKAERVTPKSKYVPVRYIVKVNSVGMQEAQCIQVEDAEHLYVTDEYIVTHNTFTALAAVQHVQSIGVKKKTIFVVPNSVLSNWKKEADFAYASTDDCLFVGLREKRGGKMQADSKFYAEDLQRIRENKHSKIFMTLEAFQMIRLREETLQTYLDYMSVQDESYEGSESNKENERTNGAKNKILTALTSGQKAAAPYLEDLGVDSLVIDEAHMYKNSAQIRSFRGAKFLSIAGASSRGLDAQAKAWFIRGENTAEDGVLLLTATPITNSPLEIFSMLSLAVGTQRVNSLMGGTRGADAFMETVCEKDEETIEGVDGRERVGQVFKGLNNLAMLRRALGDIATICDAKSVGQSVRVPDGSQQYQTVQLDQTAMERLNKYKEIWHAASRVAAAEEAGKKPDSRDVALLEENANRTGEPVDVTKSVFNLISKMTKEIIDPDLVDRVTTYTYPEDQRELAERVKDEFESLKISEERFYLPKLVEKSSDYKVKEIVDQVTGDKSHIYLLNVHAHTAEGIANSIQIDSSDPDVQDKFEKIADKLGLALGVSDSPKIAAMLENFKKEQTEPRGIKADGTKASVVKQIIFCDFLGTHNKIKRLLSSRCGVPAGKVAIVTGQKNNKPDQIMEVQDGFNAEEGENKYQVIIANEKAEVGINLQKGTQAIHHLTIGWTPDSIEQRNGRGVRQGNKIDYVNVYYYDADGTFDALKRLMVNKKAGWIEQVTSSDSGDNVRIEGGLSREQLEALANCKTADDVLKYQQSEEERERQSRIANTKRRQAIAIELVTTQKKFLEETTSDTVLAAQEIVKALTLRTTIDNVTAYLDKHAGKEDTPAYKRNVSTRDGAQKSLDSILKRLDTSVTIFGKWSKAPYESAEAAVKELYYGSRDKQFSVRGISYYVEIVSKGSGPIYDDWVAARAAAERLIETSSDEFKRYGEEEGGIKGAFIEQVKTGDGKMVDGFCIGEGTFVYFSDHLGDVLGVGLPGMAAERDSGRTNNPYSETVALVHFEPKGRDWNYETGKEVKRTSEFRVITRVVMPGDADYEEALKKAAELEDALVAEGGQTNPFSQIVPSVKNYRKTASLEYFPYEDVKLPSPYFPYIVTLSSARNNELCTRIYNEQREVVKFDTGFGDTVGIDTTKFEIEIHRDAKRDSALQVERVIAFEALASGGQKYPFTVCRKMGYRRYLTENRNPAQHVNDYDACTTQEEVDSVTRAYINAELPGLDISNTSQTVVDGILPDVMTTALEAAEARIAAAEATEKEANIGDDDLVDVAGNSYKWKDALKRVAQEECDAIFWNPTRKVWRVRMIIWRKMVEKHPECVKDIHYEVR